MADWNAVRKGWGYQRKQSILFVTNWSPKYLVLYSQPIPALALYEQRSDATPPYAPIMHIDLQGLQIEGVENGFEKSTKWIEKMKLALLDISGKGSKAGSRKVSLFQENTQNAHRDTRSNSLSLPEPGMDCKGRLLSIYRPATSQLPAIKLCFALNSIEDRNAWVVAIKQVLQTIDDQRLVAVNSRLAASLLSQASSNVIESTLSLQEAPSNEDRCRLLFSGATVLDSNSLERILKLSSTREPWHRSSNDSIKTNQITSSNDILPESKNKDLTVQQVHEAFHRAIASRRDAKNPEERFFYEIEAFQALYKFHTIVAEKAIPILDKLHCHSSHQPFNNLEDGLVLYEEKSTGLCIQFIADYMMTYTDAGQDVDVLVEAASKWLHQEMLAIRWINQQTGGAIHGSLIAIIGYKGFRVMGHVQMLPSSFPAWDLEAGIYDNELHEELQAASLLMNTQNNYSWNLSDGRLIQNFLHPHIKARKIGNKYHLHNLHDLIHQWPESGGSFRPEFLQSFPQTIAQGVLPTERSHQLLRLLINQKIDELLEKLASLELIPLDSREWTRVFHSFGINCSLLGVVAQRTTLPHINVALIIEMIARTVKNSLSVQLRETVLHFRQVRALRVEEELAMIVLSTFNALLFVGSSVGTRFSELFQAISSRYCYPQEINTLLRGFQSPVALAWALQYHCGVILTEEAMEKIAEQMGPLDEDDFLSFDVRIGPTAFDSSALKMSNFDEVSILTFKLIRLLSTSSELSLKSPLIRAELALILFDISRESPSIEVSKFFYDMASRIAPKHHVINALMTIERIEIGQNSQSVQNISQAERTALNVVRTCFGSHHPLELTLRKRSLELYDKIKSQEATEHALDSCKAGLATAQKVLGLGHASTRNFLIQIGDLYGNLGFYEDAIRSLEDALKSASCPSEQAVIYLKICSFRKLTNDYESAIMNARKALRIMDESRKSEDKKFVHSILETISQLAESIYDQEFITNQIESKASFGIMTCLKLVPESMAEYLREALQCYERLFHEKRLANENDAVSGITQPSNADAKDEIVLAELVKKIFFMRIRLAKPAQKTIIGALERNLANLDSKEQQRLGETARDLLVRLLSGAVSPEDYITRTLEASESISEQSQAVQVVLSLIRLI